MLALRRATPLLARATLSRATTRALPVLARPLGAITANVDGRRWLSASFAARAAAAAMPKRVDPIDEAEEAEKVLEELAEESKPAALFADVKDKLDPKLYRAITQKPFRYETMTDVQAAVLSLLPDLSAPLKPDTPPPTDLLVRAKTGTGKTLAFLVPALQSRIEQLAESAGQAPKNAGSSRRSVTKSYANQTVGALIISPTRELATQIANEARQLIEHLPDMNVRLLVGGESRSMQLRNWSRGSSDIVVATPGRANDLLESERSVRDQVANTRLLVLDEADTLLDMGFSADIDRITAHLPPKDERQTFLFSATVSKQVRQIARNTLKDQHEFIDTVGDEAPATHAHVPQYLSVVEDSAEFLPHVANLIAADQLQHGPASKIVMFLPTTKSTQLTAAFFYALTTSLPFPSTDIYELHSKKDQKARSRASDKFRQSKKPAILITSDVSARGVDYPGVTRVIQLGIPGSRESYIHRVGRTGRAGKVGRGDIVLLGFEKAWTKNVLNRNAGKEGTIALQRVSVAEAAEEVKTLAAEADANAEPVRPVRGSLRKGFDRYAPPVLAHPVASRHAQMLEDIPSRVLPAVDEHDVREAFASLLGYYAPQAQNGSFGDADVVSELKGWATGVWGIEQEPYVGAEFLKKVGLGRASRGGFGRGGGDRRGGGGGSRAPWQDRGSTRGRGRGSFDDDSRGPRRGFGGSDRGDSFGGRSFGGQDRGGFGERESRPFRDRGGGGGRGFGDGEGRRSTFSRRD